VKCSPLSEDNRDPIRHNRLTSDLFAMTLYPSIAVSDSFNALANVGAAYIAHKAECPHAQLGFLLVTIASVSGVIRFGISESWEDVNSYLSDLVAFFGLPLVGHQFVLLHTKHNKLLDLLALSLVLECCTRTDQDAGEATTERQLAIVCLNIFSFIGPALFTSWRSREFCTAIGAVLFVIAGVGIGGDRDETLLGVRRMNLFHYFIGASGVMLGLGLKKVNEKKNVSEEERTSMI